MFPSKDIDEIVLEYTTTVIVPVKQLRLREFFEDNLVQNMWVKYGRLYLKLSNDTVIGEDILGESYPETDYKWPTSMQVIDVNGDSMELVD